MGPNYEFEVSTPEVVDGDTVRVVVDLGFRVRFDTSIRLAEVDAPELHTDEGKLSRCALRDFVAEHDTGQWLARTYKGGDDKYGRWLARVFAPDGTEMNEWLIAEGHATRYE